MSVIDISEIEDHERFRAELASIQPDGKRRWIFARKPHGQLTLWRMVVSAILVTFLFSAPFIKVNGHQFLLLNIIERKFVLFGMPFWPNDFYLVAVLFLTGIVSFVVITASIGRIWCGWLCPQTVFMEMIFRRIEWAINGSPVEQARRRSGPWTIDRIGRTTATIVVFFAVSFAIANVFLSYVLSSESLLQYVYDGPLAHVELFGGLVFFSFVFFMVFYRFREQACLIACPYGRYMSALVDENTVAVTYDIVRGEQRAKWDKHDVHAQREAVAKGQPITRAEGKGQCIDCHQCVTVCPTGIDIRNGIQLECVNCTACIDACNNVMKSVGLETGLIRYTSLKSVEAGAKQTFMTRRIVAYLVVWMLLMSVVVTLFALRKDLDVVVLRQEGTTWVQTSEGIVNFYQLQLINKSPELVSYSMRVLSPEGYSLKSLGMPDHLASMQILKGRFIIKRNPAGRARSQDNVVVEVSYGDGKRQQITTSFLAP
jgi:cytochrome c oxidase accessory protein FixG